MTTFLIIVGLIMAVVGLVGCIFPVLPGPVFGCLALFVLSFAKDWQVFGTTFLVVMTLLTIVVLILDYVIPAVFAKKFQGSKYGIWGSVIGLMVGAFIFPPWGIFFGAFAGALAGELLSGQEGLAALKISWGVFLGTIATMGLKLALCGAILFFYIKALF